MAKLDVITANITNVSELIRKKEISPVEVIDAFFERINAVHKKLNAFITILEWQAREAAKQAEEEIMRGHYRGPLHGIPFAAKDDLFAAGVKATFGSRILDNFIPKKNATIIDRLMEAGAILIGKTNLHEFALGATGLNYYYGSVRNPWNLEHITGGSSSGSAAAIAGSCALLALGSDAGGSIRIPAALCGIVGIKPTYGRVSKHGAWTLAWSLEHIGALTRTVADTALALSCMAGYDPRDPCSRDVPVPDYYARLTGEVKDIRVGIPDTFYFDRIEPEVKAEVEKAIDGLKDLGAEVKSVHIPDLDKAAAATLVILSCEASSALEKFHRTRPDDIGDDVRDRLDVGALNLATNYIKAQRIRRIAQEDFSKVLKQVDILVTPGVSITAPKSLDPASTVWLEGNDVPISVALPHCTRIYDLVGLPSLSIPVGFSSAGLPIGMQIAGRPYDEEMIIRAGEAYQRHIYEQRSWPLLS